MKSILLKKLITFIIIFSLITPIICTNNIYAHTGVADDPNVRAGDGTVEGLRATLFLAIKELPEKINNMAENHDEYIIRPACKGLSGSDKAYDKDTTLDEFFKLRFPYDKSLDGNVNKKPRIGDILTIQSLKYSHSEDPYKNDYATMSDINFSEIISAFSLSEDKGDGKGFSWGTNNYQDFEEFIIQDDCKNYMFEIDFKWKPIYKGSAPNKDEYKEDIKKIEYDITEEESPEDCRAYMFDHPIIRISDDSALNGYVDCEPVGFWIKTRIKPMGLRELFYIVFGNEYEGEINECAKEAFFDMHNDYDMHTRASMFDYTEKINRTFNRGYIKTVKGRNINALGIAYDMNRNKDEDWEGCYSPITEDWEKYEKNKNCEEPCWTIEDKEIDEFTGRSAWYYIKEIDNERLFKDFESELVKKVKETEKLDLDMVFPEDLLEYIDKEDLAKLNQIIANAPPEDFVQGKWLQGNTLTQFNAIMNKYLTKVEIDVGNGKKMTMTVHKDIAEATKNAVESMVKAGLVIEEFNGGYVPKVNNINDRILSEHSYGLAFDINATKNPMVDKNSNADKNINKTDPAFIKKEYANIAKEYGLYQGIWKNSNDYMHFSVRNR